MNERCCHCVPLETSCLLIGYMGITVSVFSIIFFAFEPWSIFAVLYLGYPLLHPFFLLATCAACVYGIHLSKRVFMLPHLICSWLSVVIVTVWLTYDFVDICLRYDSVINHGNLAEALWVMLLIARAIVLVLLIWFTILFQKLYKLIEQKLSTPSHVSSA